MDTGAASVAIAGAGLVWGGATWLMSRAMGRVALDAAERARVGELARQVEQLVGEKERTHAAILDQMREDRRVTDRRLRWLEEHLWRSGGQGRPAGYDRPV